MNAARTAGTTAILLAARVAGAGLTFLAQALIVQALGAEGLGRFFVLMAAMGLLAAILPLGFQATAQFFVAEYDTTARRGLQRGFLATAYRTVAATSALAVAAAITLVAMGKVEASWAALTVAGAPAWAVIAVNCGAALSLGRAYMAMLPDLFLKPAGALVAVVALREAGLLSASTLVGASVALAWLLAMQQSVRLGALLDARGTLAAPRAHEARRWWRFAPAWLVIVAVAEFIVDLDMLLLAPFLSASDLAVFGVATRIFVLAGFALTAVYALTMPRVFAAGRDGGRAAYQAALAEANLAAIATALGCLVFAALAGPFVLSAFGPGFAEAMPAVLILVATLVARALFGPANVALSIEDRPYAALPPILGGLALLVALNVLLVPRAGVTGAALALALAMTAWSAGQWLVALRITGRNVAFDPGAFAAALTRLTPRRPAAQRLD